MLARFATRLPSAYSDPCGPPTGFTLTAVTVAITIVTITVVTATGSAMSGSRTLILMRHATAGHQGASTDHDRPLTPSGRRDADAAGDWIRNTQPAVDVVLCSTALRTRQTLAATRIEAPVTFADELYGGGIDDILEQIAGLPGSAGTALVVGHAPGIPATALELLTIAAVARAGDAVADAADPATQDDPEPEPDGLRHFSAGAVAVLSTEASWSELADHGADLITVRHPD